MLGAEMIIQVLADEGVDTVFGYSGGAILPTYDAVFRHNQKHTDNNIQLVVPANEQGAGFMASGYARSSGKVGVFLVTSGPGATNAVTPIRDCMADSVPVVMLSGQVPTAAIGTDAFQEAPIYNIMSSCAKEVFLVTDPNKLEATVRSAFEIARSGRPGPVVVDIPKDVQNWEGSFDGSSLLPIERFIATTKKQQNNAVSDAQCKSLLQALKRSKRPVIYAGGGIINSNASPQLLAFCELLQIPVVNTLTGIGCIDTGHDLSYGMLGMHGTAYANYAIEDCDFLLAVGARFDDRVAGKVDAFAPNAKYIGHIDIDVSEVGKIKAVDWSHVSDAKIALQSLTAYQQKNKTVQKDFAAWHKHLRALRKKHAMAYNPDTTLIQPQKVIEMLSKLTKGKAIVSTGVGQHQMWAAQFFDFKGPRQWLSSGSMGTMGFGLPAAIGAQFAMPDAIVIDIDGDGSLRMNLGELETATTYKTPVKVLLLNNQGDGMVRQWQKLFFFNRFSGSDKSLHKKDFVMAAKADGFEFAERVDHVEQLEQVLADFVAFKGPAFLSVMIDPDAEVYPMVGPGMGYSGMITGPYINGRASAQPQESQQGTKSDLF